MGIEDLRVMSVWAGGLVEVWVENKGGILLYEININLMLSDLRISLVTICLKDMKN